MASILLDSLQITAEDEEYIQALDHKYDSLRKRVFLLTLKDKLDWKNFSKEEKQHSLRDIMRQEKLLRSEGRLSEMDQLVGMRVKMLPPLRSLVGEDKAEYQRRLGQNKPDEDPTDPNKVSNILADLVPRYDNEQDFLLSWLHSHEAKGLSLRMKRMRIVELKVETCRIDMEEDCEIAAVSAGLMERVKESLSRRHPSDEDRQAQLARKRVQLRGQRLRENVEYRKEPEISKDQLPKKGDITGRQVIYLHEMLKRHRDERELTLGYLQDESIDDLIEVASTMTDNDRQQRLTELQGKRNNLNLTFQDDQEEHSSILEEASALRAVGVKQQLVAAGNTATMEAIAVVILAELQEEQDKELALTLQHLEDMNEEDINTGLHREISNRSLGTAWNVINVLTRYQGEATDDALLKALEAKYLELRKMLLADSLRVRLGSDKWDSLSTQDKEQKLSSVEAQYQEQAQLGRIMPSLLGETFVLHETIPQLMGVCPHVFSNKVKGQIITGHHANLHMEEDQGAVSKRGEPENPLKQLITRFEEEKLALVRQIKGQSEHYFGESDRQVQLACYQRECILAGQQQNFVTTATRVGLMERQQEEVKFRLMKDKERYERLAKSVMTDIEKGRQQELSLDNTMVGSSNEMDMTLRMLENKHLQERELFQRLLSSGHKYEDLRQQAAVCSGQQLLNKLTGLREARIKFVLDRHCENLEILTEATVYKVEGRRNQVTVVTGDVSEEQLHVSLMADLLEQQNSEAMRVIRKLSGANEQEIKQYQGKIRQNQKSNMADNIAAVVLSPDLSDGTSETDILDALKGKYDALKDKLLAEALMKELGDSIWNRMSEKERQKRIFQLKLKEKQLRREGKIDEANALIAGLLKEQEHLRKLMGDSTQDQRERLQERLRRRKERLAQGMSKEEVDRLEKEEIEQEKEEERNKHRNILEDLDNRFEQERDEILRRLQEAGSDLEKERERQANLARLHRDERLARMEDKFGSAALILGLSEKRDKDLRLQKDEERERQERLARERLEAARQRRGKGSKPSDDVDDAMQQVDTEDTVSLQEAIAHYMDRKQRREMDLFIQLLEENVDGKHRKAARGMSSEERDDKMFELRELHKNWTMSDDKDPKVELELIKEMIGYLSEIVKGQLEADGRSAGNDDIQVALLADLQEQHKKESQRLLNDIETKDLEALQELHKALSLLNKDSHHDNITAVLLGHQTGERLEEEEEEEELDEGETSKREVLKVLEQKYDAIKDKLLIEALMKEHGEREWEMMSEKDRQRKLIELKLKERKLRREGRQDEIANIIGSHLQDEKLLDELMTESKKSQRQRLEERLARRKQLIAEREEAGLATDDNTIEEILDEEEKQEEIEKRRNILENLQQNFDAEREALLRSLSHQKDKVQRERERQIALAKLKRQERQMKKGEKLDSIAMIISSSREDDKRRENQIAAEKDRQRSIALERIEARRRKKNKPVETEADMEKKLAEDEEKMKLEDALLDVEGHNIHETVTVALETKQEEEMNMLMSMLELAKTDRSVESKPDGDLKSELAQMEQEHGRWRRNSTQVFMAIDRAHLTEEDSQKHLGVVAKQRKELQKLLTGALARRLEMDRRSLRQKDPNLSADQTEQEVQVALVTDLQMKHTSEGRAIQHMLDEEDDATLREVRKSQQIAAREGWYQNLVNTIFHVPSLGAGAGPVEEIEEAFHNTLAQMEEEFEQEKQEVIRKAREQAGEGEDIDEEAVTRELMQQYENKKQQLLDQMNSQREAMLKKLEKRRMSQDQKDYEELASRAILKMAKDQMVSSEKNLEQERDKQSSLLQQRLAERREARKMARDVKESMERENTLDVFDQDRSKSSSSKRSTGDSATPPFGMRREKTVVDVDVSEEQKQAQLNRMIQQQKDLQSKISEQQRKQEEMLKRRIEARKGKQKSEAAELLSLGQRQKTILESAQQDEKQRQLQKMKERVSGMKEKREPSPSKYKRGEN